MQDLVWLFFTMTAIIFTFLGSKFGKWKTIRSLKRKKVIKINEHGIPVRYEETINQ